MDSFVSLSVTIRSDEGEAIVAVKRPSEELTTTGSADSGWVVVSGGVVSVMVVSGIVVMGEDVDSVADDSGAVESVGLVGMLWQPVSTAQRISGMRSFLGCMISSSF